MDALARLEPDPDNQDLILRQVEDYKESKGEFGLPMAIRNITKVSPGNKIS